MALDVESTCDRPATKPTDEIVVTSEMVDVGMHEYATGSTLTFLSPV